MIRRDVSTYTRTLLCTLSLLLWAACATSGQVDKAGGAGALDREAAAEAEEAPAPSGEIPPAPPAEGATTVTALTWGSPDLVHLGWADGTFASVDIESKTVQARHVGKADFPIAAISPDGRMALIASLPVVIFNTDTNQPILHFPDVKKLMSARFAPDGAFLAVAESNGRIHLWKRAQLRQSKGEENLKSLLARQNPALSTRFAPFSSPIAINGLGHIVFSDDRGHVFTWDLKQQQTFKVMKLQAPARSVAGTDTHVIATSRAGNLGVASVNPPRFEKWSRSAASVLVATAPDDPSKVAMADLGTVTLKDVKSGQATWTTPVSGGELCGLSYASLGGPLALCIDNAVVFLDGATGAPTSMLQNVDGQISWVDAAGEPIASPPKVAAPAAKRSSASR